MSKTFRRVLPINLHTNVKTRIYLYNIIEVVVDIARCVEARFLVDGWLVSRRWELEVCVQILLHVMSDILERD